MSLGIRGKLLLLSALAIALLVGAAGFFVESTVEDTLQTRLEHELQRHAKAVGVMLETAAAGDSLDDVADRAAEATSAEIAIFDLAGRTLGSSSLAPIELEQLGTASSDPEVLAAASSETSSALRYDDARELTVMFVARKVAAPRGAVIARAAAPLNTAHARGAIRGTAVVAGLVGAVVVGLLLFAVGSQVERVLQPVVSSAAAVKAAETLDGEEPDADDGPPSLRSVAVELERTVGTLSSERNQFEAVLQTMEQAVIVLGPDQRISTVNRAAHTLLSLPERPVGRTLLEAVRVPRLKQLAEEAAEGGTHSDEFDLPGGRRIDARATQQGDEGLVLVAQDVTEIRRLERVRRDFVANVSHELRTPISVVKANTETLLDGGLDDPKVGRMFVEAIHRHADRLGRIVNDLLDISRIEAGRYPLNPGRINVGEIVDHVLDLVEVDAQKKKISVSVSVEPDLAVIADRKAMEHILINLTSNAFKYTQDGGSVEVTAFAADADHVRIEVLDDGPGIDPAHRGRIFERFFRADSGRSRDMGGTGLGLSIVKHLVDAHDGEVGVDPRSPRGSVFWFMLTSDGDASANEARVASATAEK